MGTQLLERARDSAAVAERPDFRWVLWLSPENLKAFQQAVATALQGQMSDAAVTEMLDDWRATAELDAAPEIVAEMQRSKRYLPLSDFITS